jgi:hypothetical protein
MKIIPKHIRGKRVIQVCKQCGHKFEARAAKVRQGEGLFCNRRCYHLYRGMKSHPNKTYRRAIILRKCRYGLSEEEYLAMFVSQSNKCAICEINFDTKKAYVDHCHVTNKFRGLLCSQCNIALGAAKDNPTIILRAIAYLKANS